MNQFITRLMRYAGGGRREEKKLSGFPWMLGGASSQNILILPEAIPPTDLGVFARP
jgi:hypothetical protein